MRASYYSLARMEPWHRNRAWCRGHGAPRSGHEREARCVTLMWVSAKREPTSAWTRMNDEMGIKENLFTLNQYSVMS